MHASSGTHAVFAAVLPVQPGATDCPCRLSSWLRTSAGWAPLPDVPGNLTLIGVHGLVALPSGSALVGNPTLTFGVRRLE